MNQFARSLTKKEMKEIKGGEGGSIKCPDGSTLSADCGSGWKYVGNPAGGSVKCCSYAYDCCITKRCGERSPIIISDEKLCKRALLDN